MLSNGINLLEDQRKILPLLAVFAALFRYTLLSVYDSDFYGNDTGEINFIIFRPCVNFLLQLIGKVIRLVVRHCLHSFFSEIAAKLKVILYCFILQTIDYI